jgi:cytoskeletal protein CcmA (bactofilin family)
MIKAGSLFYAIIISLIIAIVSSSLILFAYLTKIQFENFEINQQLNLNADSGLNLLLSKQSLVELNQQKTIDLFNSGTDNVILNRKSWGAYEILIAKAVFKNTEVTRIALAGFYPDSAHSYSLYLSDEDKPLALCGNTLIKGRAYLPKAGVKRAYIEGQSFTGNTLIDGQIKQSEKILPKFNKDLVDNIKTVFLKKSITANDSIISIQRDLSGDTLINNFQNKTLVLINSGLMRISAGTYSGNIVIISDKQITISSNAVLKDLMIFAPKIIIENEFRGNMQAFAYDSIIINKNVTLTYPSVLGLLKDDKSTNTSAIILNENDSIAGNVFVYKNEADVLKQAGLIIREKAIVFGQVYSNGYVDIKGTIIGSLMCNKIILNTSSSVYENHLLNAVIDASKRSKYYVGINLVEESAIKNG